MNERLGIDLANQIENRWTKDSILAIKNKSLEFAIKIRTDDKKLLRKKFILDHKDKSNKRRNRKVISLIYCFLLYKIIKMNKDNIRKVLICRDEGPSYLISKYISKICKYYNDEPVTNYISLKFRKSGRKSKAHKLANNILKGRRKENYCLTKQDISELKDIIRKNI